EQPHATWIAITGEKITGLGEQAAHLPRAAMYYDLHGFSVTPGLVDAHCHLYGLGIDLESVSVRGAANEAAAAQIVAEAAKTRPAGEWLVGRGWDQNRWP